MALVNSGMPVITSLLMSTGIPFDATHAYIGVGDGTAAVTVDQTNLAGANTVRKAMEAGYPVVNGSSITFKATFLESEANFSWEEWGIFNAAVGGSMLNRVVEANGTKQSNQKWTMEVTVTFEPEAIV